MDALRISQRPGHRSGSGSRAWRAKRLFAHVPECASGMPSARGAPARAGRGNGSARIQTRRVKTRTPTRWIVTREEQGLRLDRFLAAPGRLGSRGRVRVALERGQVFRQRRRGLGAGRRLAGDVRRRRAPVDRPAWQRPPSHRSVLRRGRPASAPADPLRGRDAARRQQAGGASRRAAGTTQASRRPPTACMADHLGPRGRRKPFIVHRIDRDTSGIVVFAKTAQAQQAHQETSSPRGEPERVYWAVVHGHPHPAAGPMARSPGVG